MTSDFASPDPDDNSSARKPISPVLIIRTIAILSFGLLFPLFIALGVSARIDKAELFVEEATNHSYVMEQFARRPVPFRSGNDYALIALADSERANLAVMINKQVMKLVVVYMGFAVMSFAMMFIVLGFTDAPVSASGTVSGVGFSMQFGSIGAAVFVLGAAMAAGGGLLRNDYRTVGLPAFQGSSAILPELKGQVADVVATCALIDAEAEQVECLKSSIAAATPK